MQFQVSEAREVRKQPRDLAEERDIVRPQLQTADCVQVHLTSRALCRTDQGSDNFGVFMSVEVRVGP
jgi:hypothetical protein